MKGGIFIIDYQTAKSFLLPKHYSGKIPANIESALDIIKQIPNYKNKKEDWLKAQSYRTVWKILYDWVQVQVVMIQLKHADPMQVFLSYAYNPKTGQTFYEKLRDSNFKQLTE